MAVRKWNASPALALELVIVSVASKAARFCSSPSARLAFLLSSRCAFRSRGEDLETISRHGDRIAVARSRNGRPRGYANDFAERLRRAGQAHP